MPDVRNKALRNHRVANHPKNRTFTRGIGAFEITGPNEFTMRLYSETKRVRLRDGVLEVYGAKGFAPVEAGQRPQLRGALADLLKELPDRLQWEPEADGVKPESVPEYVLANAMVETLLNPSAKRDINIDQRDALIHRGDWVFSADTLEGFKRWPKMVSVASAKVTDTDFSVVTEPGLVSARITSNGTLEVKGEAQEAFHTPKPNEAAVLKVILKRVQDASVSSDDRDTKMWGGTVPSGPPTIKTMLALLEPKPTANQPGWNKPKK